MKALALAVTLAAAVLTSEAAADVHRSESNYFEVELPDGLELTTTIAATGEATTLVATAKGKGLYAAVTRVGFPNPRAWRKRDSGFFREIEAGLAKSTPGYRRFSHKRHKLGRVPALDISFIRTAGTRRERVFARFLFFRTFSITIMAAVPERAPRRARRSAERLTESFKPYFK